MYSDGNSDNDNNIRLKSCCVIANRDLMRRCLLLLFTFPSVLPSSSFTSPRLSSVPPFIIDLFSALPPFLDSVSFPFLCHLFVFASTRSERSEKRIYDMLIEKKRKETAVIRVYKSDVKNYHTKQTNKQEQTSV